MRLFDYIGEFFLFRWFFDRTRESERQEMSAPDCANNDKDFERFCEMDEDYDCYEDFLDEQEDYDMMDDDF